jgi:3-deoxy-D-manno-octulosonic-acid transferase
VPRALYSLVFSLLLPPILLYFLWRSLREPAYRRGWAERFGFGPAPRPGGLWLHAASVGEVQAARPLVESLLSRHPDHALSVSCITPAGAQRARELWAGRVSVCYLPFDTPGAVARFLARAQPRLALVLETEIWPNLYAACAARGIPLLIVSARLSEAALARFSRFPGAGLLRTTLQSVTAVLAQSEADAERYRRAGARET